MKVRRRGGGFSGWFRGSGRTGVISVVLLAVTTAGALFLADRFGLGSGAVLVGVLGGVPGLYLLWATYRDAAQAAAGERSGLGGVADQLALAVRSGWDGEARARRLNDPYPLEVRWAAAAELADSWDVVMRLAAGGTGRPPHEDDPGWADGFDGLVGGGGELAEVLGRVPTGRLVVLGEPGAGKTMLMVRLVLDLLARRERGGPVPVLVSLASWDPAARDLRGWLSGRLELSYPALASPAPGAAGTCGQALLDAGLIIPVLDGLDEIPDPARGLALSCISDVLRPDQRLVLTCRTAEYQRIAQSGGGIVLRAAAAVRLCPLDPAVVAAYLRDDAGSAAGAARWDPVLACLGTDAPVARVLTTPLMVGLARTVYDTRPAASPAVIGDPGELCGLAGETAVRNHLLDVFVPAAYRSAGARWPARKAEGWLAFLARYLERAGDPGLAWWKLPAAVPIAAVTAVALMTGTALLALALLALGLLVTRTPGTDVLDGATGLALGLLGGLAVVVAAAWRTAPGTSRQAVWQLGIPGWLSVIVLAAASVIVSVLPGSGLSGLLLPYEIALAGVLAAGFAAAFRDPPPPARAGARWPARAGWTARGLALGFSGGLGAFLGLYLGVFIAPSTDGSSPSLARQLAESVLTCGLMICGGIAGILTASLSTRRREAPAPPRGTRMLKVISRLGPGLMLGSAVWIMAPVFGGTLLEVLASGVPICGLIAVVRQRHPEPSRGFRWRPGISSVAATIVITAGGFELADAGLGDAAGLYAGLPIAVTVFLVTGFATGLQGVPRTASTAAGPRSVLARDRRAALTTLAAGFLTVGLAAIVALVIAAGPPVTKALPAGLGDGSTYRTIRFVITGIVAGIIFGAAISALNAAWLSYQLTKAWLAIRRLLPWSLMKFLDDAHARGILRQDGATYQFRHIELQHRLANRSRQHH